MRGGVSEDQVIELSQLMILQLQKVPMMKLMMEQLLVVAVYYYYLSPSLIHHLLVHDALLPSSPTIVRCYPRLQMQVWFPRG